MEYVIEIIDLDHKGRGIGKINNKIVFVPNSLPNEIVKIRIIKDKKNYSEGIVLDIIKSSEKRVMNLCNYYPFCGGCQLLHLKYSDQLIYKENKIKNIFEKYNLPTSKIKNIIYGKKQFNYRNKLTLHEKDGKIGYFQEKTNDIIQIDKCLLLNDFINKELKNINFKKEIVIRSNGKDITYQDSKKIMHTIVDCNFLVSNNSFFQVNDEVTELLYKQILAYLKPTKQDIIMDLYCGTGTIGIFISQYAKKVIGIEINANAISDANDNKKINNINNINFICGDAGVESKKLALKPDSIIIDPPRSGLNKETVQTILDLNPRKIVYVSCDPMTLVRDLNILKEKYDIIETTPFDMFPNTYHVECVSLLFRK